MSAAAVKRSTPRQVIRPATASSMSSVESCVSEPMVELGFEGARHLIPERLPSARRRQKAVAMRVNDFSDETISTVKEVSHTLRRLDLSNRNLVMLTDDFVTTLQNLHKLDLSRNELTEESFPTAFKLLDKVIELNLNENRLTQLPKTMQRLKNMSRLKVSQNNLETLEGIEKLKRLTVLVAEDNEIVGLSRDVYNNLKKLEFLHINDNQIKEIHSDIRFMKHLRMVDISGNCLQTLPSEIFLLPKMETLNASNNQIGRLPSINTKGKVHRKLASIDLSDNLLIKFPEHLLVLCDALDLGANKIKTIPTSILKKLDWKTDQTVSLSGNPLTSPPIEICESGLKTIIQYYEEAKAHMKVYQGLKLLVIGSCNAGKTSLVQTLVDQQPRLTHSSEQTIGVDLYEITIDLEEGVPYGKNLQLCVFDFAGRDEYMYSNYYFIQQKSLMLLVFNMADYKAEKFHHLIGRWIDWVIAKTNKLVLLPVGTHADKIKPKRIKEICEEVSNKLQEHIKNHVELIKKEINKIEDKPHISPALSEQLKLYIALLKVETSIHHKVIPVSAATYKGMDDLLNSVEEIGMNKELFPNVLRVIPSLWIEAEHYIEDRGYALKIPMLRWEDYFHEVTGRFGMKHLMEQITEYLHDIGKVLWYSDHPYLKKWVILRPSWITDLLKPMFRHDLEDLEFSADEAAKMFNFTQGKYERMKRDYLLDGALDRELLKYMWSAHIPQDLNKPLIAILSTLIEDFEMGYKFNKPILESRKSSVRPPSLTRKESGIIRERSRERIGSASSSRATSSDERTRIGSATKQEKVENGKVTEDGKQEVAPMTRVVIVSQKKSPQPANFTQDYELFENNPGLAAVFRFPKYTPPGLFEALVVRALKKERELKMIYHWSGALYARHTTKPIRFFLMRIDHTGRDCSTCIRTEVRHETSVDEEGIEDLWNILLPYIKDVEAVVALYAGARFERYMECPQCHALAFLGEWLTPKELQGMKTKMCDNCHNEISTSYLVQPKGKKRIEDFLKQKLEREMALKQQIVSTIAEESEEQDKTKKNPKVFKRASSKMSLNKKMSKSNIEPPV